MITKNRCGTLFKICKLFILLFCLFFLLALKHNSVAFCASDLNSDECPAPTFSPEQLKTAEKFKPDSVNITYESLCLPSSDYEFVYSTDFEYIVNSESVFAKTLQYMKFTAANPGSAMLTVYDTYDHSKYARIQFTVDDCGNITYTLKPYSRLVNAIKSGNLSALNSDEKKMAVLVINVCKRIINSNMSDAKKVFVIHNWIVNYADYAYDDYMAGSLTQDDHDYYGVLLNRSAVCDGYAKTFDLFMRVLGIEEMVVKGQVYSWPDGYVNHEWNMVYLYGHWYYVDCTFDDPINFKNGIRTDSLSFGYLFFNDYNILNHLCDHDVFPKADGV